MKQDYWTYNKPLSMTGLGGGATSLSNTGAAGFISYNEPKLSDGSGLTFGPYDNVGNVLVGYLGPTKANLRIYYKNSSSWGSWVDNDDYFSTTSTGIQVWRVPESRTYTIEMQTPKFHVLNGRGRHLRFDYDLTAGDRLFILPGQRCNPVVDSNTSMGGNGGTFLVMGDSSEADLDADLLSRNVSDVIAVCGGAGRGYTTASDAAAPGSHPSGSDAETSVNHGSGRGIQNYHGLPDGGPSGGAGFLKGACQHNVTATQFFVYSDKQDSTSFIYDADSFVRGGLGGRGYNHTQWSSPSQLGQSNNGFNGSGGFGGGGGQSTGNSYNSGAGGFQGGNENDGGSTGTYPSNYKYSNGADRIQGGGSYVKSGISLTTNQYGTGSLGYVNIKFT
tara:strand:+ start:745 stop:1911 length:1167 start_codon:yes stop_codon:yes gene_type:complete